MMAMFSLIQVGLAVVLGTTCDLFLLTAIMLFRNWEVAKTAITRHVSTESLLHATAVLASTYAAIQIVRFVIGLSSRSTSTQDCILKPMFFPCQTSHTRLFPTKHSFAYSYLLTGIPIGWKGSVGGMISVDEERRTDPWYLRLLSLTPWNPWFVVNGSHYLERGHVEGGLRGKLDQFLHKQGARPEDYPYAYLLTAAQFLGYSDNPVSIWNLYSPQKELKALVLEVNNTFDERHIYLVTPKDSDSDATGKPTKFVNTWSKDFYVSPFNPRGGSYSVAATDAFYPAMTGTGPVNVTLTLSSTERPFLVARVVSAGAPIDPGSMTIWQKTCFLATWWWVGLATFPRTVLQAVKLFKKKLPWVFRPEPRKTTLAKHADHHQQAIESVFRKYIREAVSSCKMPLTVKYTPSGLLENTSEFLSSRAGPGDVVDFHVLTPDFYTNFIKYPGTLDALESEAQKETIYCSSNEFFSGMSVPVEGLHMTAKTNATLSRPNLYDALFFLLTRAASRPSQFDTFITKLDEPSKLAVYKSYLFKLLLSDKIALGSIDILDLEIFVAKFVWFWFLAGKL